MYKLLHASVNNQVDHFSGKPRNVGNFTAVKECRGKCQMLEKKCIRKNCLVLTLHFNLGLLNLLGDWEHFDRIVTDGNMCVTLCKTVKK